MLPGYKTLAGYAEASLSGSSTTIDIYNPQNFDMAWWTQSTSTDTPLPGYTTVKFNAQKLPFSDTINLPAPYAQPAPTGIVDGASASWNESSRTLSFDSVTGANGYWVCLTDDSHLPRSQGMILMRSSSVTLLSGLVSSVLIPGTGWDLLAIPAYSPQFNAGTILGFFLSMDLS